MSMKLDELLQELQKPFRPSDVYWKPGSVNKEGTKALALPYATLRAYQQRLDTICGLAWAVTYTPWSDRIICHLTISDVTRSSTGEPDSQAERSEIAGTSAEAQAFKRACAMFGLGRYLYHMPNLWVAYDAGARQFTDEANAKLEGVVVAHYQRAMGQAAEESVSEQAETAESVIKQEEAAENAVPAKLRKQFEALGSELYGERWAEVSRHNAARLTENQTDDPNALTVEQMQKLINGMKQLKRQRRTAKPHTKESTGGDRLARVVEGGDTYFIPDPDVLVYTSAGEWIPVEILFSEAEWQQFLRTQSVKIGAQEQDSPYANMNDFADTWAQRLLEEGWLAHGEKVDRPTGRIAGCQSTNHTECYGELWQCAACNKVVCYAEGTDNHPELCDDCWAARYEPTIVLACNCSEKACGTWLELTPDGILALEDKDGIRVSIMLPAWLDEAIRNASPVQQVMETKSEKEN